MIPCDHCSRTVSIAPGRFNVSVAHVRALVSTAGKGEPCTGNERRTHASKLVHLSQQIALQHDVLTNDAYWEGL